MPPSWLTQQVEFMKRRPKFPFLLLIAVSVLILTASAVVVIPRYIRWRRTVDIEHANNLRKARCLMRIYTDALHRHPDFELARYREFFTSFQGLAVARQASGVAELEQSRGELRAELMKLAGIERDPTGIEKDPTGIERDPTGIERDPTGIEKDPTGIEKEPIGVDLAGNPQYKTFSPNGFKRLSDSHRYADVQPITSPPRITGHAGADSRIIRIAEDRGYRLRADTDIGTMVKVEGRLLKPQAAEAYARLREAASKDGIRLGLISGYRSFNYQRRIFLNLLRIESTERMGREFTPEEIAGGKADGALDRILEESSIPGYSKHHTGYTLDLTDRTSGRDFTEFVHTRGFEWISANNFLNAKRFGFIPSYPEGVSDQGPEPESWEYVWVGEEVLREPPPCD